MTWLFKRLSEGSTWAGFAALIPLVYQAVSGGNITPEGVGAIAAGVAAVMLKDKAQPVPPQ